MNSPSSILVLNRGWKWHGRGRSTPEARQLCQEDQGRSPTGSSKVRRHSGKPFPFSQVQTSNNCMMAAMGTQESKLRNRNRPLQSQDVCGPKKVKPVFTPLTPPSVSQSLGSRHVRGSVTCVAQGISGQRITVGRPRELRNARDKQRVSSSGNGPESYPRTLAGQAGVWQLRQKDPTRLAAQLSPGPVA